MNSFENLLLLCGTHHPPVDQHDSAYTVEELEEWKEGQIAQSGTHLSAADSAEVFDHIRRSLAQLTQVDVVVELRVGRMAGGGMVLGALKSLRRVTISEDGGATYVAVQVDNRGFVPVTVNAAGLEFSYQRGPEHDTFHLFDTWVDTKRGRISRGAGRLSHHDDMTWICQSDSVYAGLRELLVRYGSLPCYVRPFAELATLDPVRSDEWLPLTDLAPYLLPDDHPDAPFT
ncbi:hypothetical protein MTQ01_03825 [Streptomyces sp. XM4193]|uniref:hypothetical protein n=1 Tax=Streptomyces sp. XM4193 TaxID=2929782 RepID=UPI001FF876C6|nr:hypothetical protein [Streptomyces sp. XM4193]MCK1795149.1 hypothetical protein [Streptomyces sp. XM4193]